MLHIVDFYVSRLTLSDADLVHVVLEGLLWLVDQQLLDADCAIKVCTYGFFSNLSIPSLHKQQRRISFRLLLALISNESTRNGLISMKLEFVRGFIGSIEGEKDPECLMSVFSIHHFVLQNFELSNLAEDHFNSMAAYFPLDYSPVVSLSLCPVYNLFRCFNIDQSYGCS